MNSNRIKEILTKGLILTTITGTLVCKGPNILSDNNVKVYALSNFETSKNKMINKLEKLYSKYNKKYYEGKDYTTLTSYYNSGIKKLKSLSEKNSSSKEVEKVYKEYEEKMNKIKPTILVSYQKSQEKKVLKKYKSLIKSNGYSKNNSEELEVIKDTSIEKIYKTKTKTKAKNIRIECINSLESVKTLLEEEKEDVIYYINTNKNISESDKKAIIERINSTNDIKVIESIGSEYNYEKNEKVTIKDIEDRIKSLCKKYKAYTEDEIRCLVATANLDYIDDSELFSVYKVNNFEGLKSKMLKADELLNRLVKSVNLERYDRYAQKIHYYVREEYNCVDYNDIIWPCDLILDESNKERINYMCSLLKNIVEDDITKKDEDNYSNGDKTIDVYSTKAFKTYRVFYHWLLNEYKDKYVQDYFSFDPDLTIGVNELTGSKGYVLGKFIYNVMNSGYSTSIRWNGSRGCLELDDKCEKLLESKLDNVNSYIYNEMEKYEKVLIKK